MSDIKFINRQLASHHISMDEFRQVSRVRSIIVQIDRSYRMRKNKILTQFWMNKHLPLQIEKRIKMETKDWTLGRSSFNMRAAKFIYDLSLF